MRYLNKIIYYYSNFSGKAGKVEYLIYLFIQLISGVIIINLNAITNWTDKSIMNLFYIYLIFLILFIPIQAVTTRRLRDLEINRSLVFLNFIPGINILFKIYLTLANSKNRKRNKVIDVNTSGSI